MDVLRGEGADRSGDAPRDSSIVAALDIVGDRWTILILRDAFRGIRRFDEIRRDLDIPRAVLAERLRRLVEHGVLVKRPYQDRPVRYEYRLTAMGLELSPILVALMHWGDRWITDGPETVLVHEPCGSEVDLHLHCWTCDTDYSPTEIASRPGPAAAADAPDPAGTDPAADSAVSTDSTHSTTRRGGTQGARSTDAVRPAAS